MRQSYRTLGFLFLAVALAAALPVLADHDGGNLDELRFGTEIDAQGVVPAKAHSTHFLPDATIHMTMKVQEAQKGTKLLVNVLDRETEKLVWSQEQAVPGGHTTMHFTIPSRAIPPGKYRAKVKLGNDWVADQDLRIE
jgi:hypothetical protein